MRAWRRRAAIRSAGCFRSSTSSTAPCPCGTKTPTAGELAAGHAAQRHSRLVADGQEDKVGGDFGGVAAGAAEDDGRGRDADRLGAEVAGDGAAREQAVDFRKQPILDAFGIKLGAAV